MPNCPAAAASAIHAQRGTLTEVADEVRAGLVSVVSARDVYGVVVDEAGSLDEAGTTALRAKNTG